MTDTIEVRTEDLRLLVDLAGVSRNPRAAPDSIAPLIGGSARARAARKAHDRVRQQLREVNDGG